MDQAIKTFGTNSGLVCESKTLKVGEIPFDFQRRMSSVIFNGEGKQCLVCKVGPIAYNSFVVFDKDE